MIRDVDDLRQLRDRELRKAGKEAVGTIAAKAEVTDCSIDRSEEIR